MYSCKRVCGPECTCWRSSSGGQLATLTSMANHMQRAGQYCKALHRCHNSIAHCPHIVARPCILIAAATRWALTPQFRLYQSTSVPSGAAAARSALLPARHIDVSACHAAFAVAARASRHGRQAGAHAQRPQGAARQVMGCAYIFLYTSAIICLRQMHLNPCPRAYCARRVRGAHCRTICCCCVGTHVGTAMRRPDMGLASSTLCHDCTAGTRTGTRNCGTGTEPRAGTVPKGTAPKGTAASGGGRTAASAAGRTPSAADTPAAAAASAPPRATGTGSPPAGRIGRRTGTGSRRDGQRTRTGAPRGRRSATGTATGTGPGGQTAAAAGTVAAVATAAAAGGRRTAPPMAGMTARRTAEPSLRRASCHRRQRRSRRLR